MHQQPFCDSTILFRCGWCSRFWLCDSRWHWNKNLGTGTDQKQKWSADLLWQSHSNHPSLMYRIAVQKHSSKAIRHGSRFETVVHLIVCLFVCLFAPWLRHSISNLSVVALTWFRLLMDCSVDSRINCCWFVSIRLLIYWFVDPSFYRWTDSFIFVNSSASMYIFVSLTTTNGLHCAAISAMCCAITIELIEIYIDPISWESLLSYGLRTHKTRYIAIVLKVAHGKKW